MNETNELRRLLDERGVEYEVDDGKTVRVTRWKAYGEWVSFIEYDTGETRFCTDMRRFTPAQAIAATLGSEDTYTREDVEGAFVSGYSLGLDMFDSSKQEKGWNQNERNLDEEMEDLGWVRKDAATLGRGTCHMEQDFRRWDDDLGWLTSYTCSVCGESVILMSDRKPSRCPNCGRRVVEVDE